MKPFRISATAVGYLEKVVEANNAEEASALLEQLLEQGEMPETAGWIEDQQVEEVYRFSLADSPADSTG